ncbi:hypothetical protein [Pseudonocardia kunmingensis]|uniref:hypothetical protein n=1 Tax=Pseudonocardia kunmingensis TaxID=630975 RepID=UPI0011532C4F|nr:hypothetical protein [Pseudonocardia kunmingensis]
MGVAISIVLVRARLPLPVSGMQLDEVTAAFVSAALLFLSSSASPFNADGTNRIAIVGLAGRLGWAAWIITCSIAMIRT